MLPTLKKPFVRVPVLSKATVSTAPKNHEEFKENIRISINITQFHCETMFLIPMRSMTEEPRTSTPLLAALAIAHTVGIGDAITMAQGQAKTNSTNPR